jgi:hypothetical protein
MKKGQANMFEMSCNMLGVVVLYAEHRLRLDLDQ